MSKNPTRRDVIAGSTAAAIAAVVPAAVVPEPELSVSEWLEQVELEAIRQPWLKPYPLGAHPTAQEWEDHEDRNQPWARKA
jgi:hypothetical protein